MLIPGVTDPKEAYKLLDKQYGDKGVTVLGEMHRIISLKFSQVPVHRKVEALVKGVNTARTCLKAVGAEKELFAGYVTIGTLVGK